MPPTFTIPVTLVTRAVTGQDSDGNDVYGTTTTVVQGVYAPGGSAETVNASDLVVTQPAVYLPSPAPTAVDAVQIFGFTYEVDGDPEDYSLQPNPFTGWVPDFPVVVKLKKVTG